MLAKLPSILNKFQITGEFLDAAPIEIGHINATYQVTLQDGPNKSLYVLQKINTQIFKNPLEVMHNIANIGHFLTKKSYPRKVLLPIESFENKYVLKIANDYWRLYPFIQNTITYNQVDTTEQAYAAAFAFGEYANYLHDFEVTSLHTTIPNFHNTNLRYQQFLKAIKDGVGERKKKAEVAINQLLNYKYLLNKIKQTKLPLRVTHNDTKINNILFDKISGAAVCVIDLDTLMPDTLLFDYGDMVRTFTPALDENSDDFKQIYVRKEMLNALTEGYLAGLDGKLTALEKELLMYGGKLTIFEQALRFLTDYLQGDVYYKVAKEEQNLIRTKNQICLLESLMDIDG
ncbi:MAG: phosphotransferase enzyme family protein [Saprospiraceae bacterium]